MLNNAVKRPPSEDLIDLHVFVVPIQSWLGKYSVAYNNVALQSTSAGFIRVYSHATLQIVRELIEEQLETDVIPEDYVFLRSVGRCLAVVNQNQEKTLKAKHFLPPVAFSPEIFILPGSHEWIASLRKQTKSIVVNGDIALQDEYRLKSGDFYGREASDDYPFSEQYSDDGDVNANRYSQKDRAIQHSGGEDGNGTPPEMGKTPESDNEPENRDPSEMLLQNAYSKRNRQHFADVVKAKKRSAGKGGYATQNNNGYAAQAKNGYAAQAKNGYATQAKNGYRSKQEDSPKQRNAKYAQTDSSNLEPSGNYKKYSQENWESERKRSENDKYMTKTDKYLQQSSRSPKEDVEGRGRSVRGTSERANGIEQDGGNSPRHVKSDGDSPSGQKNSSNGIENDKNVRRSRSETFPRANPAIQVLHPEIITNPSTPYALTRPTPIPSANVIHSTLTMENYERPSESKIGRNDEVRASDESKSPLQPEVEPDVENPAEEDVNERDDELQVNNRYAKSERSPSQRAPNPEDVKRKEEEKRRQEEEKMKMEEKKKNMQNDAMQMMKEMEDLLRQKKEEEEKRRLEEEKRKQEEKERIEQKKVEAFQLRDQLIKIREERIQRQKEREGLMKSARELKAKLAAKRSAEPSTWEKKYLSEKERALHLEEELNLLKSELGASQKKLLKSLETKETDVPGEQKSPRTVIGPSQLNNLKNEVRRISKQKEVLESDIEKTKRKLAIESQQKAAAHKELKDLRNFKRAAATKAEKDQLPRTKLSSVDTT